MRITTINSTYTITDEKTLKNISKGDKIYNLEITAYIEEESRSRHITLNISPDSSITEQVDIWLDIDIYQAELLGRNLLQLVENRKQYLESKLKEE